VSARVCNGGIRAGRPRHHHRRDCRSNGLCRAERADYSSKHGDGLDLPNRQHGHRQLHYRGTAGYCPLPGTLTGPPYVIDQNSGRPSRAWQWSFGVQRAIARDLVVEAAWVGNPGMWYPTSVLTNFNALTPRGLLADGPTAIRTSTSRLTPGRLLAISQPTTQYLRGVRIKPCDTPWAIGRWESFSYTQAVCRSRFPLRRTT
jgi:hypothetical protein